MSSIHANSIFDVILMAGKTGGVTSRHKAICAGFITRQGDLINSNQVVQDFPPATDDTARLEDGSLFELSLTKTLMRPMAEESAPR